MRCRTCDYVLFNLREPVCPECGTAFDIRSYKFRKETVAFACPHCEALHGGEGDRYLPATTDSAQCQACGREMTVAAMRVVPLVPLDQVEAILETLVPWEERQRIGRLSAWWKTITMSMFRPGELGRRIDGTTSLRQAYWFATWVITPGVVVHGVLFAAIFAVIAIGLALGGGGSGSSGAMGGTVLLLMIVGFTLLTAAAVILIFPLGVLFYACLGHLTLRLLGKATQPFRATAATYLYATGPGWVLVVPICGYYVHGIFQIWGSVSTAIAIKNLHKTTGWIAFVAVYGFPLLLFAALITLVLVAEANNW